MAVEAGEAVPPLGRSERERVFLEFEQALICAAEAFYRFAGVALGPLGKQNKLTGQENVILQQLMFTPAAQRQRLEPVQQSRRHLQHPIQPAQAHRGGHDRESAGKHQSRHALSPHCRRPGGDRVSGAARRELLIGPSGSINDIEAQLKSATNAMSLLTGLYDRVSRVLAGRF